uniref:Uncharacterized protein n=1 Tax=uncultured marine thaumarchaeote KM3_85_E11 TaxID=1456317 RepID=A0A075HZA6_9ARCH|nr:hypothetical protein [uncultured marine thaumarchaeote KM3_85_E11]
MKRLDAIPFDKARKFARSLKLEGQKDWGEYSKSGKRPKYIPANPRRTYKKEWKGWGDWLGTGYIAPIYRQYCSFNEARKYARTLGLKRRDEWNAHNILRTKRQNSKTRNDVPRDPRSVYKKEWKGWGNFLGTENIAPISKKYRSFKEARKFVHELKLESRQEWQKYYMKGKIPKDIPKHPEDTYKNKGWKGMGDWLGTGYIANRDRKYLPPIEAKIEARKIAKKLGIKTPRQWHDAYKAGKIPSNLPGSLWGTYYYEREKRKK